MSISKVTIANIALQKLGTPSRISALDQDHPNARSINACYDVVRRRLLRKYDWAFAIARKSIAAEGDGTLFGDWNRYALPNDYIRLLLDDEADTIVDWRIEGQYIVTADDSPLEIRYIADIDDPNYYDAQFVDAFACELALQCCEEVTGSTSKKGDIIDERKDALNEAKRLGSIERAEKNFPEDEWLTARY